MSASRLSDVLWSSIVALLLSLPASAQSPQLTLTIHVTDPAGAPVAGARVAAALRDDRLRVIRVSDSAGNARFETLSPGTYVLDVDAPGFASAARTVAVRAGVPRITISLDLAAVIEHVVVTGAGHLQTTSEVWKAVTVVDSREIAARNEFSVADALRTVPGASVQQLGGAGSFTSVKLRGLREQDTAFLIDGVRFRDAAAPQGDATAFIGELFIANLDRIEVLRGSGSSLYGSHAIGGAVNLITASGYGRPSADVSAEAGGLGFSRVTAHTAGGALADRATFSLGAGYTRTLRGVDGDDDARNTSVQGRGSVRLGASARVTVRFYGSDALSSINESPAALGPLPATGFVEAGPATFAPGANDPDDVRASNFLSTLVSLEQRPSSAFGYTVSFHRLGTDRVFRDGPLGVSAFEPVTRTSARFKATVDTLNARADREWSTRQATSVAYEFERERYVSESLPVNVALAWNADMTQDSHAASVHHEVRLTALQVAGSVRAQRFALEDVALVPAERAPFAAASFASPPSALTADIAATRLFARSGTKLRAHAGNAYRAPAMFERAGVSFGSRGYSVFGDPGIEPERSMSVDAGVDQTLWRGHALVSATWFHTRLTRTIAFQSLDRATDVFGRSSGYRSADGRTARGVELSTRLHPHRTLQVAVAYTFVDAPPPAGDRDGLPRASAVSAHLFSTLVTQTLGPLQLSFELEAASDHYATLFDPVSFGSRAYRFTRVTRGDVAGSYRIPIRRHAVRLFGTVENVFDRRYFVQGFATAGRTARVGLAVTF
jgi:iron complex outermembrane receptor protein